MPALLLMFPLLLGLAGRGNAADGASGSVHRTAGHGLQLNIDTRWLDGFGYRPVRVTIIPSAPVIADRTLRLEFLVVPAVGGRMGYDLRVRRDIEIPAGTAPSTPTNVTLSVPDYGRWRLYALNVFEDGERRDPLCVGWTQVPYSANVCAESLPTLLVVGDSDPDTSELAALLSVEKYQQFQNRATARPYSATSVTSTSQQLPTAEACALADLPRRWIDYTSLDVVCLSLEQLGQLKKSRPAALTAVLQWTAAGGNLWVYGVGEDWQRLGQLEELIGLAPPSKGDSPVFAAKTSVSEATPVPPRESGQSPGKFRGWSEPDKKLFGRPSPLEFGQDATAGATGILPVPEPSTAQPPVPPAAKPPQRPPFLLRPLDLGLIAAIAADSPFRQKSSGWKQAEWNWLLHAVGPDRWLWPQRHGMSMLRENGEFWDFLIPGVGLAPVVEFCVLITLFVLVIGPLNYWLLRRWKRLHLLVLTTPAGAAALTLLLFAYALLADGLGTRVRVRSITEIDQRRGQAVCWARLSYYAGLAPWRGLSFPEDVAVFPLERAPMAYSNHAAGRDLIWEDNQRLASGWLSSRTPTQFITVRSRPTTRGLQLLEPAGTSGKLMVKNGLGTPIDRVAVRTADNQYYWGAAIGVDATAGLEPIEAGDAQRRLAQDRQGHQPAFPPGISQRDSGGIFGLSPARYYRYGWSGLSNLPAPLQATGRLEKSLATFGDLFAGGDSLPPPAGYVAVVADSPEVVLAVPSARQEASYHVIVGRW